MCFLGVSVISNDEEIKKFVETCNLTVETLIIPMKMTSEMNVILHHLLPKD